MREAEKLSISIISFRSARITKIWFFFCDMYLKAYEYSQAFFLATDFFQQFEGVHH